MVAIEKELAGLQAETIKENFWLDSKTSGEVLTKIKRLEKKRNVFLKIKTELDNLMEMSELLLAEQDNEMEQEVLTNTVKIEEEIDKLEIETFFNGKYDKNNCILTIHPGAGRNRITRLGRDAI